MSNKIIVLHENGAPEHYRGLAYFCKAKNIDLKYREFRILRQFASGIKNRKPERMLKAIVNLFFLMNLITSSRKVIILGIAPFDFNMILFNWLAKRHYMYLHTSWPHWDGSRVAKKMSNQILDSFAKKSWKSFLEIRCKGIFCVSVQSEKALKANFNISCPTQVVYHSLNKNIFNFNSAKTRNNPLKFLYVGRLVENKGIRHLLKLLNKFNPEAFNLGIVGNGELQWEVESRQEEFRNLHYFGRVPNTDLGRIYSNYDVLLLPSQKGLSGDWEELFGIALIEAMACGLVPIASDHIGPKEIIEHGQNGLLIKDTNLENELADSIRKLSELSDEQFSIMQKSAIYSAQKFEESHIASLWAKLLQEIGD